MPTWIFWGLSYALFNAIAVTLDKKVLINRNIDAVAFSMIRYVFNAAVSYIFILIFFSNIADNANSKIIILSICYFFAGLTYFYALKFGDVSKLIPFHNTTTALLSFFLAIFLLSEKFISLDFLGVLIIIIGGYIIWTDGKLIVPAKTVGIVLIAISGVFIALNGIAAKYLVASMHPVFMSFYMYSFTAFYFVIVVLLFKREEMLKTLRAIFSSARFFTMTMLASVFAVAGITMLFFALSVQTAAKVLPIIGTLPLFAALIGWLILKEKHGIARVFGSILLVIGVYVLSLG